MHGQHGVLGFTLLASCRSIGQLYVQMDDPCSLVRRVWPGQLAKGKEKSIGFLFWVMVLLLSVWVCLLLFACMSGLNNRSGVSGIHVAGQTSSSKYTQKYKYIQRRAHKQTKTKNRYSDARNKIYKTGRTSTNTQQKIQRERQT